MRKLLFMAAVVLLTIASCTKKAAPTATTVKKSDPVVTAIDGGPIYAQNCARCHGATGKEGRAPSLTRDEFTHFEVADKVTNGAGRMPAFATKLSGKEIDAVAEFVVHLRAR